jgi:hypothetical protein
MRASSSALHLFQFGLLLVGSIIVIGLVLAAILIRKRPKHPQQNYETPGTNQSDWGKYYEKK